MTRYQDYAPECSEYMCERDKLIPLAVRYANQRVKIEQYQNEDKWHDAWNRCFHARMNLMWEKVRKGIKHNNG